MNEEQEKVKKTADLKKSAPDMFLSVRSGSGAQNTTSWHEITNNAVNFFISNGTEATNALDQINGRITVQRDTLKTLAIFTQVKPIPLKSSSTSGWMFIDGLPGRPAIDGRDK